MKAFVIGSENCVLGFALAGLGGVTVRSAAELHAELDRRMDDPELALVLISADVAAWARERVDALKVNSLRPLLVEIPGEHTGTSYPPLREFVQRAVGVHLERS
ncbi:MAG: V-type ATP synthase subunit F [Anaerolineae bacterium]|jgi:V/A-type H+-transporting ATPase subunit F